MLSGFRVWKWKEMEIFVGLLTSEHEVAAVAMEPQMQLLHLFALLRQVNSWHSSFGLWKKRRTRVWQLQGKAQWRGSEACMIDLLHLSRPPTATRDLLMNVWCLTTHMGVCHLGSMKRLMSRKWSEKQIGLEKVSNMRRSDAFVCIHHRYSFSICNDDGFTMTLKYVDTTLVSHILSFYSQTLQCIWLVLHVIDRQKVQYL